MKYKVTLSIGFPQAKHTSVIDVDDDELAECETEDEREELLYEHWKDWANNYIDAGIEPVE